MPGQTARPNGKVPALKGKKQKAPFWAKAVTTFGAVLALFSLTGIVGVKYFMGQLTDNIQTTSSVLDGESGGGSAASTGGKLPDGAMNFLMLGLDTRQGWEQKGQTSRSDTMIILHISKAHDQAYMISIPRDAEVDIPADSSLGTNATRDKINGAYALGSENKRGWTGGAKLATKTVHEITGIDFDGVVVIDFDGFKGILEAMGGVYMCVDKDSWSSHYIIVDGKVKYAEGANPENPPRNALWFKKGCRNMAPWEALEFSRIRHSANGDYDRQRHQQQLLRAMAKKASSAGTLTNPAKVSAILKAAGSSLKMDTHGVGVQDFIFGLKSIAAADLIPVKTNGGTFAPTSDGKAETLNGDTLDLFKATADDNLREFLVRHPQMLISDGSAGTK
ncbi:LCP family protein [Paractinoplanes globisporus]|uniref:LCP family protein n=1 Tax=Paractinoplanes globisporus TaxID=113565 RepID=A0ABW6W9E1_9ACTN|nr:LCP family protein [Actinoplanes globisporus]